MNTKRFLNDNLLLSCRTAEKLYHSVSDLPIYDFHTHLSADEIAENKRFSNLAELWLAHDHYKWRLMRIMGVAEEYITGDAADYDKFLAYVSVLERSVGNPLYIWSHMELEFYFGISLPITRENAEEIWNTANAVIAAPDFSVRSLLEKSNVRLLATTNDPTDDLSAHRKLAEDETFSVKVVPTFRPDRAFSPDRADFTDYINQFSDMRGRPIDTFSDLKKALTERLEDFISLGSLISDHGLCPQDVPLISDEEATVIMQKGLDRESISQPELMQYQNTLFCYLASEYRRLDMSMQLHIGALRNVNTPAYLTLGADAGFDTIGESLSPTALCRVLNHLEKENILPRTVIYSSNPTDAAALSAMCGNFTEEGIKSKVQMGAAWWFNDHKDGIKRHLTELSARSVLSSFIGMLTDSRSFLSFVRHDYFRRILCSFIGNEVEENAIPTDFSVLEKLASDISFQNAKDYFKM